MSCTLNNLMSKNTFKTKIDVQSANFVIQRVLWDIVPDTHPGVTRRSLLAILTLVPGSFFPLRALGQYSLVRTKFSSPVFCLPGCYLQCWCILCLSLYIHICSQALTCCSMCTIPQARWDLSQESCIAAKHFECSTFFHKLDCNIIIFCASHTEQIPCYDIAGILTAWCMTRGAG